jgi:hypothetical protein
MRISVARSVAAAVAAGCALALLSAPAGAQQLPSSINTPPQGAGTEQITPRGQVVMREGIEASAALGTGFADTYGLGFAGRVGYTFRQGVYAGGAAQYYVGHSVNGNQAHASFIGGEAGYKFYPTPALEIRPYAFVGPGFITQVASNPFMTITKADLALQPGVLAMYHFGSAFIGGDAHVMVIPTPNTLAVLASGGIGF